MQKPKYLRNANKPWDSKDEQKLSQLAKKNTPTRVMGLLLGRSENSIYSKASQLGVSLDPTNQSPYNRRKK